MLHCTRGMLREAYSRYIGAITYFICHYNLTRRVALAAPGKFEVKSHGSLSHNNDCKLFPLTAILPQTSWDLLITCVALPKRERLTSGGGAAVPGWPLPGRVTASVPPRGSGARTGPPRPRGRPSPSTARAAPRQTCLHRCGHPPSP